MPSPFRRRPARGAASRAPREASQRHARLHIETLEARLALSASTLDGYELVNAAWAGVGAAQGAQNIQIAPATQSEWIVRLTAAAVQQAGGVMGAAAVLGDLGFSYDVIAGLGLPGQVLVKAYNVADAVARQAFEASDVVAYAGHNATIRGAITNPNENDFQQGRLFGLNISAASGVGNFPAIDSDIDAPEAWDITRGNSSLVVAVLDSGVDYNHVDLAGNMAAGGLGYDFYGYHANGAGDANPMDEHGHGTHVAGIIGAEGNNNVGVVGVNWDVSLLPVRILGPTNAGDIADAIMGINYVTGLAMGQNIVTGQSITPVNVRVINASWTVAGQFVEQAAKVALVDAIQAAGEREILFVTAAGNGDILNNALDLNNASALPATLERDQAVSLDNMIVVAASDPYNRLTYFSNYGAGVVDLAAPGDDILSTLPGGDYGYRDGTSMATPFVSGVAALVLTNSANPDLTAAEVKQAILASVDPLATPDDRAKVSTGGRLNAASAVNYAAFAPRVTVQSAPDILASGAVSHAVTLRYTGKTAINTTTLGVNDIVVRRSTDGDPLVIQGFSFAAVAGTSGKSVDVTYTIAGPGDGVWNAVDNGDYQIEVVAGSVSDQTQAVEAKTFDGAAGFSVNIAAGVFIVQRTDDSLDTNPGNGLPDFATPGVGFTLRGALQEANLVPGSVVIVRPGTYMLRSVQAGEDAGLTGDLDILGNVTIAGDGTGDVIIVAGPTDRAFDVRPGGTLNLSGVELRQQAVTPLIAPLVTAGGDVTIQTGATFTSQGALTDADSTSWTGTVNYGEGAGAQPLAVNPDKTLALSNVYETAGTYTVTVTVADANGLKGTQAFVVTVKDAALGASVSFAQTATLATAPNGPGALAAGDLTGDGITDVITGNYDSSSLSLFRGKGDGTYESPTTISGVSSQDDLAVADLNHDSVLDLIVPHGVVGRSGSVQVLLGLGNGTFSAPVDYDTGQGAWFAIGVTVGDYDGDGHADIATVNYGRFNETGSVTILWGHGDGTFELGGGGSLLNRMTDLVAGNIDADPALELLAINASSYDVNILNSTGVRSYSVSSFTVSTGTSNVPNAEDFMQATLANLNGDANLDFAVVDRQSRLMHVMFGNGDGTFQPAVPYNVGTAGLDEVVAGDVNGDGWVDLVVTTGAVLVYLNQGNGAFVPQPPIVIPGGRDTVLKDVDGNGSLDLAVLREDGSNEVRVFLNQGLSGNPHLTVAAPDAVRSGEAFPVVVTIRNAAGHVRTDFTGAVAFRSSLAGAQLPANYTFTPGDAGSHTFWLARSSVSEETLSVHLASDLSRFDRTEIVLPSLAAAGEVLGGGLRNAGVATLEQVEIIGFTATEGGGVYNAGTLTIRRSTIEGNSTQEFATPVEAIGGEFRVNATTAGAQSQPSIDMNPSGQAVVSWTNAQATNDVAARLIDGAGNLSSEINVWAGGAADQDPDVTIDNSGGFVVAYEGFGVDAAGFGIDAIRFDAAGNVLGAPNQRISIPNIGAPGDQLEPVLIGAGDGSFIATWFDNAGNDGSGWGVHARRFDQGGNPLGSQFTVSSTTTSDQQSITGADVDASGFVLAWNGNGTGDGAGAFARLFNPSGTALGPEFRLNQTTGGVQETPRAVLLGDRIAFVWVTEGSAIEQGTYLRFFDRAGVAVSDEIRLSSAHPAEGDGRVRIPDVARLANGRFAIVWEEPNGDGAGLSIKLRVYSSTGVAVGASQTVNTTTAGDQLRPVVTSNGVDRLLVAWEGNGEGDGGGIFARQFMVHGEAVGGGIANLGTLAIETSTIADNTATQGGGVYNTGSLTLTNATVSGNTAESQGGGVFNAEGATATIASSTIDDNTALEIVDPSLIGYFRADGSAIDEAQGHGAVTLGATSYGPGQFGQAFNFDASSGTRVEVPGLSGFQSQAFTVDAWINADTVGNYNDATGGVVATKDFSATGPVATSFAILGPGNTGRFSFEVGFTDATRAGVTSSTTFAFGVWHHVSMTWDGSWLRGYVNGNLEGEVFVGPKQISYNPLAPLTIGSHSPFAGDVTSPGSGRRYDGRIDEVRLYNRALSVTEIQNQDAAVPGVGGGVFNAGTLTATNVTISGNEAANQGGGVFNASSATVNLQNATVTANSAYGAAADGLIETVGGVFQVNEFAAGVQWIPKLSVSSTGEHIVGWTSGTGPYTGTIFHSQRYGANGAAIGGNSQLSSTADSARGDVAMLPGGGYVAVYQSINADGSSLGVLARVFSANGLPVTGEFLVNTSTSLAQAAPQVESDSAGNFAVVWHSQSGGDGIGYGAFMRRFFANGTPVDGQVQVNTIGQGDQGSPEIAFWSNGEFVIVYTTNDSGDSDFGILAQRFDALGNRVGPELRVNTTTAGEQNLPTVAAGPNGFLVVWDTYNVGAYGQLYDRQGVRIGAEFPIVVGSSGGYVSPRVVALPDGNYAISGELDPDHNGIDFDVFVQVISSTGQFLTTRQVLTANSGQLGLSTWSDIGVDTQGNLLVVWDGAGPNDSQGIFGQRLRMASDGGGINNAGGTVTLSNTIVAGNSSTHASPDISGEFAPGSANIIGDAGTSHGLSHGVNANKVGNSAAPIDPKLGPLADNGGPTKTHLPAVNSPAIDAALSSGAPVKDQRGVDRPVDGDNNGSLLPDIGAVESYFASISGKKFHDRDGDGLQDVGEENLSGWTIFVDLDHDGNLDAGEQSAVTDAAGNYTIKGLTPGSYTVAEVAKPGWERTHIDSSFVQALQDDNQAGGTVGALDGARSMVATADGRFVFVAAPDEAKIARFERNATTGQLTYLGEKTSPNTVGGAPVLAGVEQLAVGTLGGVPHLYALAPSGALTVFTVNASTGDLTQLQVFLESNLPPTVPNPKQFVGSSRLAVSPDGTRVYVTNTDNGLTTTGGAIFVFERTGAGSSLAFRRRLVNDSAAPVVRGAGGTSIATLPTDGNFIFVAGDDADGVGSVAVFERANAAGNWIAYRSIIRNNENDSEGNLVHGLTDPASITVSPDGKFVYVTTYTDGTVSVFKFNSSAKTLTLVQTLESGATDPLGGVVSGLQQASAIAMSSDGDRVYVAGKEISGSVQNPTYKGTIVVFRRDVVTGTLSFLEQRVLGESDDYGGSFEFLDVVTSILAPDGKFIYVASGDYEDALTVLRRDTEGRDSVTLAVGEVRTGVNFSNRAEPGAILGQVYEELGVVNHLHDVNESALSGWQVYLDLDNNGQRGGTEPIATTDATGTYVFEELAAETTYRVRLVARPGWAVETPTSGYFEMAISPGEVVLHNDFGVRLVQPVGAGPGSLTGLIFQDVDEDGVQDPLGEPGLGGVSVFMDLNQDGDVDAGEPTTLTSSALGIEGNYTFANVPDTPFTVRINPAWLASESQRIVAPIGNTLTQQTYGLGASANPSQVASADFDFDGDLDLAVLTLDGVVSLFRNNGSGVYTALPPLAASLQATSMAVGDFNADSKPDIALASSTVNRLSIAMNTTASSSAAITFTPYSTLSTSLANWDVVAANLVGDGKTDLALAQRSAVLTSASQVVVLRSTTTGLTPTFVAETPIAVGRQPKALEVGQVDGALGQDLVVINQFDRSVQVLLSNGSSFTPALPITVPTGSTVDAPFSVSLGHFNADSKIDVLIGNSHTTILSLLLSANNANYGPGGYALYSAKPLDAKGVPRDVVVADIDNDGDRDIVVGAVQPAGVTILRNTGTATAPQFAEPELKGVANLNTADLPGVKSLLVGDFSNNGGLPDIVAVTGQIDAGSLLLYSNATVDGFYRVAAVSGAGSNLNFALASTGTPGDFDHDTDVDGVDFLAWQRGFGSTYSYGGTDFANWKTKFGDPPGSSATAEAALTFGPNLATSGDALPATSPRDQYRPVVPPVVADELFASQSLWRRDLSAVYLSRESDVLGWASRRSAVEPLDVAFASQRSFEISRFRRSADAEGESADAEFSDHRSFVEFGRFQRWRDA